MPASLPGNDPSGVNKYTLEYIKESSYTTQSVDKECCNVVHADGRIRRIKIDFTSTKGVLEACLPHTLDILNIITHVWVYGQTNPRCAIRDKDNHVVCVLRSIEVHDDEVYCIVDTGFGYEGKDISIHPVFKLSRNNYSVIKLQATYK